jgi:hypothetical protein
MINPKDKAEELVLTYLRIDNNTKEWFNKHIAKQCALIAVDEILHSHSHVFNGIKPSVYEFYNDVKNEINKL